MYPLLICVMLIAGQEKGWCLNNITKEWSPTGHVQAQRKLGCCPQSVEVRNGRECV